MKDIVNVFIMTRFFWLEILLLSFLNYPVSSHLAKVNCTHLQSKVPVVELKYMLGGQVHAIWQEDKTSGFNYTAHFCFTSPMSHSKMAYPNSCPQFQPMTGCTTRNDALNINVHQCSIPVSQYSEYTVYLSANHQGCPLKGAEVKIKPRLRIAHPGAVSKLNVKYIQKNVLTIEWTKAVIDVPLLYSVRCQKVKTSVLKPHHCCIQARLPYGHSPHYSEVCQDSQKIQNTTSTSKLRCGITHECKKGEVKNLNDFFGYLPPGVLRWPDSPPAILLQITEQQRQI